MATLARLAALAAPALPAGALPAPAPSDDCPQPRQVRVALESWKKELAKKGLSQARVTELLEKLKLKTAFARELPDVDKAGQEPRSVEIRDVDDFKAKLTAGSRPETVVQVRY